MSFVSLTLTNELVCPAIRAGASQSTQEISLSAVAVVVSALAAAELVAPSSIGVPRDRIRVASMLRIWRDRVAWIVGSCVGPSAP